MVLTPSLNPATWQQVTVTLTRTGDPTLKLAVPCTISGGARNGIDYALLSGKVKFKPGAAKAQVKIMTQ